MNNCLTVTQMLELRRARWLEKISLASNKRYPRKLFIAWTPSPRPNGRPQQTIRHGYANSIETHLQFPNPKLKTWIEIAQEHKKWAAHVEQSLKLPPNTYRPQKTLQSSYSPGDAGQK
jgi:hypothetical protein